ncbi:MAG: MarR family winged helix-turn-helix transcriptional regulator [Steroidobacteraceae bacterium]
MKAKERPPESGSAGLVDPMADRLGYQLRRVSVLMMADLGTRLAPLGMRPADVGTLLLIGANPGCRQGEVGDALGIKRANMVPLIADLVKKGFVVRARADGRSHALSLTPQGRARNVALNKLLERHEAALLSRLDQKSRQALLAALTTLRGPA